MPIVRALLDLNILYKSKYFDFIYAEHKLYYEIMGEIVKEKKASMNGYERLRYKLYRKVKGLKMGSLSSGVPKFTRLHRRFRTHEKRDVRFDTYEIYFGSRDNMEKIN